jgi:iron complex outermembrane receptor protein
LYTDNANSTINSASTVANLRAGYEGGFGRWRWAPFVGINNLLDENYIGNVRINGFGGRLYEPAPDRNLYVGMTLDYAMP